MLLSFTILELFLLFFKSFTGIVLQMQFMDRVRILLRNRIEHATLRKPMCAVAIAIYTPVPGH